MRNQRALFVTAFLIAATGGGSNHEGFSGSSNNNFTSADAGGQDFASFRAALDSGLIPAPSTLDANGFFAEHYISVAPDLLDAAKVRTTVQIDMSSPIDPDTIAKPPLDLVVVLDRSGSMLGSNKIDYAKQGTVLGAH